MSDESDTFFIAVGYIATIVILILFGVFVGCSVGRCPKFHHTSHRNEYGDITCEICKELLEKGRK